VLLRVSRHFSTFDGPATARVSILHTGGRVASRRPGAARPRASPEAALDATASVLSGSAPGLACGSPGGRLTGRHTPSTRPLPAAVLVAGHPGGLPTRRGHGF
jgi:hypothetical protein